MKVALIQCPSWSTMSPPYNLALLSACLAKDGHEVVCFDFNIKIYNYVVKKEGDRAWGVKGETTLWTEREYVADFIRRHETHIDYLINQLLNTDAKIVGFSVQDTSWHFTQEIINRIKQEDKERIIVLGGSSCFINSNQQRFFGNNNVDAICIKEGESAFLNLIRIIEENKNDNPCPGFLYRSKNGNIVDGGEVPLLENLDALPFADFSSFILSDYERKQLPISTSRGCIFRCAFCGETVVWERYRCRSARNIFTEIAHQIKKHPFIKYFFFNDSLVNGNIRMLDELCALIIDSGIRIRWGGQAAIRKEMSLGFLKKMKKAGFSQVSYGLESGSQAILEKMNKNIDLDVAEEVIRNTYRLGIRTTLNIVVGFPSEAEKEVLDTVHFIKRNINYIDDIYFHSLAIEPNSLLYERREDFDLEFPDVNWQNLWYTRDGHNNYQVRLERIELYRNIFKAKYSSNVSVFNYYFNMAELFFAREKLNEALQYYNKAKTEAKDINKANLIDNRINLIKSKTISE